MKYDIYQRLIGHVSKNQWADAKDLFESIIHQKVALRLEEEKQRTVSAEENSLHTPKKPADSKKLLLEPDEDDEKDEKAVKEDTDDPICRCGHSQDVHRHGDDQCGESGCDCTKFREK